jgi:hypothetical protein
MNTNNGYRQTTFNFNQIQNSHPNQVENPPGSPLHVPPPHVQPLVDPTPQPIPSILMKEITRLAHKYTTTFCSINNLSEQIATLTQNKADGIIPPSLETKFKKLFNTPSEASVRAMIIANTIDSLITTKREKLNELEALYNARYEDLRTSLDTPLQTCQLTIPPEQILPIFDTKIRDFKLQFILKQRNDNLKKERKREQFLLRQEKQNEVVTLSVKQLSALQNDIASLTLQVKTLKNAISKSQPKNVKAKEKLKNPRSTGTLKGKGGRKKSTTRNK